MKDEIVKLFGLKYSTETKWNIVYKSEYYVLIYNKVTRECKLKYNIKN